MSYAHAAAIDSAVPAHGRTDPAPAVVPGTVPLTASCSSGQGRRALRRGTDRRFKPPLRTVLGFIRLAERKARVPWDQRLDVQPCELNR